MSEISLFKIYKAEAHVNKDGSLLVKLFYPKNPQPLERRLNENLEFGVEIFKNLKEKKYAQIANVRNPMSSPGAGVCYLLNDNHLICSRRNMQAPNHKLYHGIYSGFLQRKKDAYSENGIRQAGLREGAEECLFITQESNTKLVVPEDAKKPTLESAHNLKLNLPSLVIPFETLPGTDILEVYEGKKHLFTMNANIDFTYESLTVLNTSYIRKVPFSSREVIPIDAEGRIKRLEFIHFNRETYVLNLAKLEGKFLGDPLENPLVYQVKVENGIPKPFSPTYSVPYFGPDGKKSESPHIWAPDNLLLKALSVLKIKGYEGKWIEHEYEREFKKLNEQKRTIS